MSTLKELLKIISVIAIISVVLGCIAYFFDAKSKSNSFNYYLYEYEYAEGIEFDKLKENDSIETTNN